jgi:ElaB/YqjD/DUF883 family membrane-anchored ribosome-binding protein
MTSMQTSAPTPTPGLAPEEVGERQSLTPDSGEAEAARSRRTMLYVVAGALGLAGLFVLLRRRSRRRRRRSRFDELTSTGEQAVQRARAVLGEALEDSRPRVEEVVAAARPRVENLAGAAVEQSRHAAELAAPHVRRARSATAALISP